ncbi:uncharacterized protein PRCAT00001802001 [Priceomyces carsonii]|uniref:uncharacterized protein n=1 Tax=Priceomyces carsonii TaxID=28549 RepID=UPI002EDB185E|nr:unnamed protein product [Priceomyces carsonii]
MLHVHSKIVRILRLCLAVTFIGGLYLITKSLTSGSETTLKSDILDTNRFLQFKTSGKESLAKHIQNSESHDLVKDTIDEKFLRELDEQTMKCPDYTEYSKHKHAPFSTGQHNFPYMRPVPKCRTFVSNAVEKVITDLKDKVQDPDMGRLIENCLPNTLDTTILWHQNSDSEEPQSFVVTGDIHAEWLRDAARQLSVYQPFIKHDNSLKTLIRGAINTQAKYVINSPYCNAFHPPRGSHVKKGNSAIDNVYPRPDWKSVFECKYELDSLASFLTLSNEYFDHSEGDASFITSSWLRAFEKLLIVLKRESQPSFDDKTGQALSYYYSFQRQTNIGSETLPLAGVGNPVNFGTGLIRSAFRPSDDATILQFFIPANIHMLVELKKARSFYLNHKHVKSNSANSMFEVVDTFIENISMGIEKYGIVQHPVYGKVYAYEVDGYGSVLFMDDANVPSLLSIPDLGYLSVNDEVYQNTRKMILSKSGNPYYLVGKYFEGIGGPHVGIYNAWPMSLLIQIRTTDDDNEIMKNLKLIMDSTAGFGLMHESIHVNSRLYDYTRSWFAWCNSEFGKTILHLAKFKPHLIFKKEFSQSPYNIDSILSNLK